MTRPPVRDDLTFLEGYHSPQVSVPVRLNTNESPTPPPAAWFDEWRAALAGIDLNRYPDRGYAELRAAIAALHGVGPQQVFCANGSNEVLQTVLLTYAGPGRTVATFEPTYQLHAHIARITGATVAEGERRADFTVDPGEVRRLLADTRPAVTFVCTPNNPTGTVATRDEVGAVIEAAPGLVVIDEAYGQFAPWSAVELVDEDRPLVVVRTFSKTWSMAGIRLGYLVGPSWLVEELDKVALPYHLDAAKQLAGTLAVRHVDLMEAQVATVVAERERIRARLAALPVQQWESGANFVLFRPLHGDGRAVWRGLLERGVLVRDCSGWPRLSGCVRVTVGTHDENTAFLDALAAVLEEGS